MELNHDELHAFRLTYQYGETRGFAAREFYGWPRSSGERFPGKGERVGTFPFFGHWPNKTYSYVFCDEIVHALQRTGWQELIDDAADQWEIMKGVLPTGERPLVYVNPISQDCLIEGGPSQLPYSYEQLVVSYLNEVNEIFIVDLDAPTGTKLSVSEWIADASEVDIECLGEPSMSTFFICAANAAFQVVYSPLGELACILAPGVESCIVSLSLYETNLTNASGDLRVAGTNSVDIAINGRRTARSRHPESGLLAWTLDRPSSVRFNTCQGDGDYTLFRMMVHEFGHALGLSSLVYDHRSEGNLEPEPHSTVPNSVLNQIDEADCSPYPLDILALEALYQGVVP